MRRGTLITIIVLFTILTAAAIWQVVLFLRAEPTGPPGPTVPIPTASP